MKTKPPIDDNVSQGFLHKALDSVHPIVMSFIGAIMGVAIALIAILQLGGLAVPVNNYLTAQLSPQVNQLKSSVDELKHIIVRIENAENRIQRADERVLTLEKTSDAQGRDIVRIKRRLGIE